MLLLTDDEIGYHWTLPGGMSSTHCGVLNAVAKAQMKKLLLGISKETKRLDRTTYLVPDYSKFKEALEEVGL